MATGAPTAMPVTAPALVATVNPAIFVNKADFTAAMPATLATAPVVATAAPNCAHSSVMALFMSISLFIVITC